MSSTILAASSLALAVVFMVMWIRARRAAHRAEIVAYGLRAQDDRDEITKTNLILKNREFHEAIKKLNQLGQVELDSWGRWVWADSGELISQR